MRATDPYLKGWALVIAAAGMLAAGRLDAQQAPPPQMPPPPGATVQQPAATTPQGRNLPGLARVIQQPSAAVVLNAEDNAAALQRLNVQQRISPQQLRANPVVTLKDGQADMRPVLANPAAIINVAQRLRQQPVLARSVADTMEVLRIDQGLVVHQTLTYQLRTGTCTDARKRASIQALGVECFARLAPAAQESALSNPRDLRYVADAGKRAEIIANMRSAMAAQQAQIDASLAQFRAMLGDPAQRAQMEREVGADELARLATLDDAALEEELVNAAEVEIDELMFVPDYRKLAGGTLVPSGLLQSIGGEQDAATGADPRLTMPLPGTRGMTLVQRKEHTIEDRVYLTGFTLGRDYEWSKGVRISINWCLIGCKETYYAELYARFNYGFGLRFPVTAGGSYDYQDVGGKKTASFTPVFRTINGGTREYLDAGLASDKLFDAKELVMQAGAEAGLRYRLPFFGSGKLGLALNVDLTGGLPPPYASGQFTPPMPGERPDPADLYFDDIDLTGGIANLGVVGGKVFPAVRFDLTSTRLEFTLTDKLTGHQRKMSRSGQPYSLSVDPQTGASEFRIGDPVYDLSFNMTPGVVARLFIDVRAWHHNADWPVWFPQLKIELPPGGQDFSCHAGTMCTREYRVSAAGASEAEGLSANPAERLPAEFAERSIRDWKRLCQDGRLKWCESAITTHFTNYRNLLTTRFKSSPFLFVIDDPFKAPSVESSVRSANDRASEIIRESEERSLRDWKGRCPDEKVKLCETAIAATFTAYRNQAAPEVERAAAAGYPDGWSRDIEKLKNEANRKAEAIIGEAGQRAARNPR